MCPQLPQKGRQHILSQGSEATGVLATAGMHCPYLRRSAPAPGRWEEGRERASRRRAGRRGERSKQTHMEAGLGRADVELQDTCAPNPHTEQARNPVVFTEHCHWWTQCLTLHFCLKEFTILSYQSFEIACVLFHVCVCVRSQVKNLR